MFFRVTEPMGCACVLYVYIYYMMICFIYVDLFKHTHTHTHTYICYEDLAHMVMEVKFQFYHLQAGDPGKLML